MKFSSPSSKTFNRQIHLVLLDIKPIYQGHELDFNLIVITVSDVKVRHLISSKSSKSPDEMTQYQIILVLVKIYDLLWMSGMSGSNYRVDIKIIVASFLF